MTDNYEEFKAQLEAEERHKEAQQDQAWAEEKQASDEWERQHEEEQIAKASHSELDYVMNNEEQYELLQRAIGETIPVCQGCGNRRWECECHFEDDHGAGCPCFTCRDD